MNGGSLSRVAISLFCFCKYCIEYDSSIKKIKYFCSRMGQSVQRHFRYLRSVMLILLMETWEISNYEQRLHDGSHAIAWAAITTSVRKVFSGPPLRRGIAVPRFGVNDNGFLGYCRKQNKYYEKHFHIINGKHFYMQLFNKRK